MTEAILLTVALAGPAVETERAPRPVHTYSIVARDPETGELGAAVQSHRFSVGSNVVWVESLPLFRRVFSIDPNWATLTPRLPRSGILPDDPAVIERILAQSR